MARSYVY